jgi:hypothetical protein
MNTSKIILISALTGVLLGTSLIMFLPRENDEIFQAANNIESPTKNSELIFSKETDFPIVSSEGLFSKTFNTVEGMFEDAEIVAEVKVLDQQVYERESFTVETLSNVEVIKLYKGDSQLTTVNVAEIGGPIDLAKEQLAYRGKPGSGEEPTVNVEREMAESTLEGVPVIKKGNQYIVFLTKNYGSETYSPTGSVQGKIKLDKDNRKAVATVAPERINEGINFFQKEFAGKDIVVLESKLQKLKSGN